MTKPDLTIIEGGKVEEYKPPARVDFKCWKCGEPCVLHPNNGNATMHSLPACDEWARIESKKEDLERFLIKSGVHMLTKQAE